MYGYNAEQPIAIPIYTVLPYCVIMQAVPISKQVNRVNIEPEIWHGNWSSYWKYNLSKLLLLVKLTLSFLTIHYNAGHTYTMQELHG